MYIADLLFSKPLTLWVVMTYRWLWLALKSRSLLTGDPSTTARSSYTWALPSSCIATYSIIIIIIIIIITSPSWLIDALPLSGFGGPQDASTYCDSTTESALIWPIQTHLTWVTVALQPSFGLVQQYSKISYRLQWQFYLIAALLLLFTCNIWVVQKINNIFRYNEKNQ